MKRRDAEAQREEPKDGITELTEGTLLDDSANSVILSSFTSPRLDGSNDWLLWQLADSGFPTGGFAHSAGLEAAWQHGEVRNRSELREWLAVSLNQVSRAALPFVNAAHAQPDQLGEFDRLCEAFTSNHVANRASRLQGRALLGAAKRIFPERALQTASTSNGHHTLKRSEGRIPSPPFAHLAPVFGAVTSSLAIAHDETIRLFVFIQLRSAIAAAVRLNIVGPMDGQATQFQLSGQAEAVTQRGIALTLDDLAQTAPLLDLWQGGQDRLYSRLFQS
ncbi:MAG TPA: urease accessory UreF family protein [Verrucomicrobiae bacterium]|nr:urease accessory UreF family protein [Verrucomicrobiae bacterium]